MEGPVYVRAQRFIQRHGVWAIPFCYLTVGIQTAYNIVMQYQKVPGLVSPLLKKMMMPYNFKAMASVLKKMLDEGKLGESSGEGFFKY